MCKLLGAAILSLLYSLLCFLSGLEDCLEQVGADIHQLLLRNRSHQTLVALDDNCLFGRILWLTQLGSPTLDTLIPARSCWLAGRGGVVGTAWSCALLIHRPGRFVWWRQVRQLRCAWDSRKSDCSVRSTFQGRKSGLRLSVGGDPRAAIFTNTK